MKTPYYFLRSTPTIPLSVFSNALYQTAIPFYIENLNDITIYSGYSFINPNLIPYDTLVKILLNSDGTKYMTVENTVRSDTSFGFEFKFYYEGIGLANDKVAEWTSLFSKEIDNKGVQAYTMTMYYDTALSQYRLGFIRSYGDYSAYPAEDWVSYFDLTEQSTEIISTWNALFSDVLTDSTVDALPDSGTGGGIGNLDPSSDFISVPSLPTLSAVDTGFVTLYNPTLSQLRALSSYMWSDDFLSNIKKLFGDPMDVILGLSIIPVAVPDGGERNVKAGNVSTGVYMNIAASQYVQVSCGYLDVPEYWGAYLDYSPYTKLLLFLPFVGYKEISADEVIGSTVGIRYNIDILSGSFVAFVTVSGSVIAQYQGTCAVNIPVTSSNYSQMISSLVSGVASVGAAAATGGVSVAGAVAAGATTSVQMKPTFEHSGSATPSGGIMGNRVPYFAITRPRQCKPGSYNKFVGFPSYITRSLGSLSGYTEIEDVHLEGIPATDAELDEIERLLKGGVFL